jgi:uncharacterized protein
MRINVTVKPRSHEARVEENDDGTYTVRVTVAAESGKANEAMRRLLASEFEVPLSAVQIVSGPRSRKKLVSIER